MLTLSQKELIREVMEKREGVDISLTKVTYRVDVEVRDSWYLPFCKSVQSKTIVEAVSAFFPSGKLSAIMGPSGAGKTSLLNIIACRVDQQEGQRLANNQSYSYEDFGFFANYVMQTDSLMSTLTVRETLDFAADLKLNFSSEVKKDRVDRLVEQLKLEKCQHTLVGGNLVKGISGGEKKRTSIAFELISDPQVLMLDEPTSGLDSLTSYVIIEYLSSLAKKMNKTVIMTIHQPNSDIFNVFDRLLLMAEGRAIYQGPASEARGYFSRYFRLQCPEFFNPSDYFMEMIHPGNPQAQRRYPQYFQNYQKIMEPVILEEVERRSKEEVEKREVELSMLTTFSTLIARDYKTVVRNPLMLKSRIIQIIFLYTYIGGLYVGTLDGNYTDSLKWNSYLGVLTFISINTFIVNLVPIMTTFSREREVFLKQEGSKLYSTTSYFLSRNLIEIPFSLILPTFQSLIVYWFAGLSSTPQQFFTFFLVLFLLTFTGMSLGLLIGCVIVDQKIIGTLTPLVALTIAVFSGYFKNLNTFPEWLGWVQYLSPLRYSFQAFVRNEIKNGYAPRFDALGLNFTIWSSLALLLALGIVCRLIGLFFLWYLKTKIQ